MEKKPQPSVLGSLGALSGIGFVIAVPPAILAVAGHWLDGITHTEPLFLLLGLLLGLISGAYGAYRLFKSVFM
ncbi:MAG: AtpZ/AtpI family protein [Ktedonobacteraceae bacterium]|nr:AtpZ/AtpI family protein [Ktedonobacteraceae bacterium]MBO0790059.1 AtpZ/AtpI family protein [Ktedonobacteraceae bacterium]